MTNKNRIKIYIFCGIVVAILALAMVILFIVNTLQFTQEIRIFSDFSELDALTEYIVADLKPDDIACVNSFAHKLEYDRKTFSLFAYEFDNPETAKAYYDSKVGASSGDVDFRLSLGTTNSLKVRYGRYVYFVQNIGIISKFEEIVEFLNTVFSVQIHE